MKIKKSKVKKFLKSVSFRLSLRFTLILFVAVMILSFIFSVTLSLRLRRQKSSELKNAAQVCYDTIKNADEKLPRHLPPLPYYITYVIYETSHNTILYTNDPLLPILPITDNAKIYLEKNYFIDGDLNILYIAKEFETKFGNIIIQTSQNMDSDSLQKYWTEFMRILLFAFIPVFLILFLVSLFITKRTIRPVVLMTESAKKISSSNLEQKLEVSKHDDELDNLAQTFNELFARLKTDFDRERQFTSDVSHELKTPVAVILGQTNLLRRWGKNDPQQLDKSLETIFSEAKSMQSIIENLLQMARLESGRVKVDLSDVELLPLFFRLKEETLCVNPDCEFIFDENTNFKVLSNAELLHQVFTVVISNSLKFVKECERKVIIKFNVKEFVSDSKKIVAVEIEDNGKGFGENVNHVFERFFREDTSHARKAGGSGLGLSIAKTIIESMNGKIFAYNSKAGGAVIRIELNSSF